MPASIMKVKIDKNSIIAFILNIFGKFAISKFSHSK